MNVKLNKWQVLFTDPFDKSGQEQIESVNNSHHCIDGRTDRQGSLQQFMKRVDHVTDSIVDTFLGRLLLCQLYTVGTSKIKFSQ